MARELASGMESVARFALATGLGPLLAAPGPLLEDFVAAARAAGGPIPAEDREAAGLAFGAAAAGRVPVLAVSGPGLGRIGEVLSAAAAAELPLVVVAVARAGPGNGNEAPAQTEYTLATRAPGSGGARALVLAPASAGEAGRLVVEAARLGRRERIPAIVLMDALLARAREGTEVPGRGRRRRPVPPAQGPVPSNTGAAPAGREALETLDRRLAGKVAGWATLAVLDSRDVVDDGIVLVAYGSAARQAATALEKARRRGWPVGLLRPVTLVPFPDREVAAALARSRGAVVVELASGQLLEDVRRLAPAGLPLSPVIRLGGAVPTPWEILDAARELLGGPP